MSRFWPRAERAEEQKYSHAIGATHELTRGLQLGSYIVASTTYFGDFDRPRPSLRVLAPTLLRSAGTGGLIGMAFIASTELLWLSQKKDIVWKEASWRLLGSSTAIANSDWKYGRMALGALRAKGMGWRAVVGGGAVGSIVGMLGHGGYMLTKYGVRKRYGATDGNLNGPWEENPFS